MKKEITIDGINIEYILKISKKAKKIRLSIYRDGDFIVTIPHRVKEKQAEYFIFKKSKWILDKIHYFENCPPVIKTKCTKKEYNLYKGEALALANNRVEHFNKIYGFNFNKIYIKNQKTRWGSCSRIGNLNFNYKIALLPEKLADYIIVHEICHLGEFNHSQRFWNLITRTTPNYKEIRKELKKSKFIL